MALVAKAGGECRLCRRVAGLEKPPGELDPALQNVEVRGEASLAQKSAVQLKTAATPDRKD